MSWIFRNSDEKLGRRLVLLVLADHANKDGTGAWPSVKTIASEARLSERQTQTCLRLLAEAGAITETGTSHHGTRIWTVNMTRGGADFAPGERNSAQEGVQSDAGGGAETAPEPSLQQPSREPSVIGPRTVDRRPVTDTESTLAQGVLASWNIQTGQRLASNDWLAKIIMRIREHPDIDLDGHAEVIALSLSEPWWRGPATPSVVYGNSAQFERCLLRLTAPTRERGMTPDEMREFQQA